MAKTNIIDAINGLEVGKTITVKKTSSGNVAHKVTLSTTQVKAEKQDYDYDAPSGTPLNDVSPDIIYNILNDPDNVFNVGSIATDGFASYTTTMDIPPTILLPVATEIKDNAFNTRTEITAVNLPKVTSIGTDAFADCPNIRSVNLPSVVNINLEAFALKSGSSNDLLTSVSLPNALTVGNSAFVSRANLKNVSMPHVTSVESYAFDMCNSLTSVYMPEVVEIGALAFEGDSLRGTLSCPNATTISDYAFVGNMLTKIYVPSATNIGEYAFAYCSPDEMKLNSLSASQVENLITLKYILGASDELAGSLNITIECKDTTMTALFDDDNRTWTFTY